MNTSTTTRPAADAVDLDLDVRIVTAGPVAAALLSSTDDGCDTKTDGDC
ncbi:FxLD family lanthipeptide [Streptomyces sp. H10-C2]|nr:MULTISPECIES: FxLD family lanthipeptide [unclassified Streptomyces]MCZ4099885.1 FxLD family lanthipeptide [Streptomyces sp. H39-C1]MCZ4123540.1 FxLD family lanthipeptide [Streptomyces sp. H39-S7]MDJ0347182.1 FxLD family lanthipeptide [Streptomyces sp. PH10-H1]MDJ0375393.1 FxLD family lanthipeptide [Streptomyces sp. H10-C2]NEA72740.1 FxLD family lantipeptide [Streptomyces sp. SID13588]